MSTQHLASIVGIIVLTTFSAPRLEADHPVFPGLHGTLSGLQESINRACYHVQSAEHRQSWRGGNVASLLGDLEENAADLTEEVVYEANDTGDIRDRGQDVVSNVTSINTDLDESHQDLAFRDAWLDVLFYTDVMAQRLNIAAPRRI